MVCIMIILLPLKKLVEQDECYQIIAKYKKNNLVSDKTTKSIRTLFSKNKYVLHIRNLDLYLELCIKLTQIHRVFQFNELLLIQS